ncbi:hypothetical protein AJ80_03165 [Polytolypa hystricis UAMH7299]|uniref:Magnesium transporter n=1 Tax=Polytolypa hystricis (strain UAMH7299) TaxID=1447883 RepID=A0A2B7YLK3_POLH7|nr:hypothetical protein AJ80_03165 [Polytolypa hystricis UAMH7299]
MPFLSRLITTFGLILISHSAYSAHEHSTLYGSAHSVPLDITLETLVAVLFVITGLVLGTETLRPIGWSVWAGEIEKDGGGRNPFRGFEDRLGFWDVRAPGLFTFLFDLGSLHQAPSSRELRRRRMVRAKRKEFADWVRGNANSTKS